MTNKLADLKLRFLPFGLLLLALEVSTQVNSGAAQSPCPRAIKVNTNYNFRGSLHFICLQATKTLPRLDVIHYTSRQVVASRQVHELGTNQLATFLDDDGVLRILLAVPDRENGTSMYSLEASGRFAEETHTINTQFVSAMTIWRLELNLEWHLAIANQPTYRPFINDKNIHANLRHPIPEPRPIISIHSWRSTYFDSYQLIRLEQEARIAKLEPMHIGDIEFLIVALESVARDRQPSIERHRDVATHSLIYRLDFGDGNLNWILYQTLRTRRAIDAKSFEMTHKSSLHKDYFIAILGQLDTESERSQLFYPSKANISDSDSHGLVIFKFLGDQFVKTNQLTLPTATKLESVSFGGENSYVVLALHSEWTHKVDLFLFDGLNLKAIASPMAPEQQVARAPHARRSMDSANVHLFLAPPQRSNLTSENEGSAVKRTMDSPLTAEVPTLAISKTHTVYLEAEDGDASGGDTSDDSVFPIPVEDLIETKSPSDETDTSHSKRNFVAANQEFLSWCKATIKQILVDDFVSVSKQLSELPRIDQHRPIELNGDLIIEDDLHVSNLLYTNQVAEVDSIKNNSFQFGLYDQQLGDYSSTFREIQVTHMEIDNVTRQVDEILVDDGSTQEVFTPLIFENLQIDCSNSAPLDPRAQRVPFNAPVCPHIDEIRTISMNNRDISGIQRQALLTGRPMTITKDVRFEHLVLQGPIRILGRLNGIPIQDIVFGKGPPGGPIVGHKNFRNGLYSSARLSVANWNGLGVNRSNFLTSSANQRIDSGLRFSSVLLDPPIEAQQTKLSSRIEHLNGLHLDTHLSQIALSNTDNKFDLPLQIDELILNGNVHFTANSLLSSINLDDVWFHTMLKHSNQNITAPMEFIGDVHVMRGGDIVVHGPVNGLPFRQNNLMMRNQNYTITNRMIFDRDVTVRDLTVKKALNTIQVVPNAEGRLELAILYNGGQQIISGEKVIDEIHLGGKTQILGNINGNLNLTQLYTLANNNGDPHIFSNIHISAPVVRVANNVQITISDTINGIPANDLCSIALRASQATSARYSRLKFEQPVVFKQLTCATINGFNNLANFFLTKRGNQQVAGTLRLVNGATFNTSLTIGRQLNNLDIAPLSGAVLKAINESRSGHRDIYGDLYVDELIAERINELKLSDVFLSRSDQPQFVRAPMTFNHLDIENILVIGNNLITNSFNGLNLSDLLTNTLQYDAPQVIYNHVQLNTLQLLPGSNLITKSLNGQDLRRVYDDAVVVDAPQQILAPKTFRGQVDLLNRGFFRHGIDGLSESEFRFNLMLQSDELIDDDLEFVTDVTIKKELEIQSGIINDMDINMFLDSMIYENRPDRKGLRILGNGSVRFHDVKVGNLMVSGLTQNVDLSREALLRSDNKNGTYDARIREQQVANNNQRILNTLYNSNAPFKVRSNYRGESLVGRCQVHACTRTTPPAGRYQQQPPTPAPLAHLRPPLPSSSSRSGEFEKFQGLYGAQQGPAIGGGVEFPRPQQLRYPQVKPQQQQVVSVVSPNVPQLMMSVINKPMSYVNESRLLSVWRPNWEIIERPMSYIMPNSSQMAAHQMSLVDPKYLEHKAMIQAQAIQDLSLRVNKFLSISFYYEIAQKHPLLGPLLHAASSPVYNDADGALLLLKSTSKFGEPCLQRGQTISVMAQQRNRKAATGAFTLSSAIGDTSNPVAVESLLVGSAHYLFILDSNFDANSELMSQVIVYLWDFKSGMYEMKQRILLHGMATATRAFRINDLGCLALANPRLIHANLSGAPIVYCQRLALSQFTEKLTVPMANVFDLDVVTLPRSSQVLLAGLSRQDTEQIGELSVSLFDTTSGHTVNVASRRLVRPLKLHFFRGNKLRPSPVQLLVSEAIMSNDAAQAITRIFTLRLAPGINGPIATASVRFYETQVIRDNQFFDIQSVSLNNQNRMLFLQSAHSISIYAPTNLMKMTNSSDHPDCDPLFSLVQRLPTKGANKFLVFNDHLNSNKSQADGILNHYLVLSREDCEQQHYSTLILRAKFK